jgi:hypothetical protein
MEVSVYETRLRLLGLLANLKLAVCFYTAIPRHVHRITDSLLHLP